MLGAICGDVIGSVFEASPVKTESFPLFSTDSRFTDDTVTTIAVAQAILQGRDYGAVLREVARGYPQAGYGALFRQWLAADESGPYGSWGNGAAMRVSPIGLAFSTLEAVLREAALSAAATHNHPEGIKGAQAVALAVWLARHGADKADIRRQIEQRMGYRLDRTLDEIRPGYAFEVSAQGSVPEAIIAFLASRDYEDAVRKAVSLGGDSDTQSCIAGAVAEAFYGGVPQAIATKVRARLPQTFITILDDFYARFGP